MALCDCGNTTGRLIVHMEAPDGTPLAEPYSTCPQCRPADFEEKPFNPLDRLVPAYEAEPHRWKKRGDEYVPTDEEHQDTEDWILKETPGIKGEQVKRETRRTAPLTEAEIQEKERQWRPIVGRLKEEYRDRALRDGSASKDQLQ